MLQKDQSTLHDFSSAIQCEWLETNGLGGWSGSTIIHAHTRRYHGLLVAATEPPTGRMVMLSKLDETILLENEQLELGTNQFGDDVISPTGNQYLKSFTKGIFPQWNYEVNGIYLKKTIAMLHGENTVLVIYDVAQSPSEFQLELLPLVAARGYHSLRHADSQMHWDINFENEIFHNQPDGITNLFIKVPGADYHHLPNWYYNFNYEEEKNRGLDFSEDLFNHGKFTVTLKEGDSLGIIISTENPAEKNAHELLAKENLRRQLLIVDEPADETVQQLALAADQFIVKREERLKTIIAGYHWFTDWGRDTMIALPGLCLSTGRLDDAKKIISAFAKHVSMGMLPNRFPDNNEAPEYNNVDGTLWYFVAIYKYLQASGDKEFVFNEILPVLMDIVDWHFRGTRYKIHADEDCLLFAGENGQQLTWMDAKVGDLVITPRMGKPVEIQALWYNVLKIFAQLLELNGQFADASMVNSSAEKAKQSFNKIFWNEEKNCLYDVIDENGQPDTSIRPNQIFAISLPFKLIEGERADAILSVVQKLLYVPVGLRTLEPTDPNYKPVYEGNVFDRDSAYHQGTAWAWLLGPYIDALVALHGKEGLIEAKKIIDNFKYHMAEAGIGTVSEIFDGDAPHHPKGCIAQAWSVGEILRVIKEYELYISDSIQIIKEKKKLEDTAEA